MTTKLDKPLKRALSIRGDPYVLTLSPDGIKLVPKGKRNGFELDWASLVSGDAALMAALHATLASSPSPPRSGVSQSEEKLRPRKKRKMGSP